MYKRMNRVKRIQRYKDLKTDLLLRLKSYPDKITRSNRRVCSTNRAKISFDERNYHQEILRYIKWCDERVDHFEKLPPIKPRMK
jgi:hypothetical protein